MHTMCSYIKQWSSHTLLMYCTLFNLPCCICAPLDVIQQQLDAFIARWEGQASDGVTVLSSVAMQEIRKLRMHIARGCLSGKHGYME